MEYLVEKRNRTYHIVSLEDNIMGDIYPDTMLVHRASNGDISTVIENHFQMLEALEEVYQHNTTLAIGDTFVTEYGNFLCRSANVTVISEAK
jgi:hypothetical protein